MNERQVDTSAQRNHRIWMLRLQLPIPYGRPITALLTFLGLLALLQWTTQAADEDAGIPLIFFSAITAYAISVFSYITEKCSEALDELRPLLSLSDDEFARRNSVLGCCSHLQWLGCLLMGLLGGTAHAFLLQQVSGDIWFDIGSDLAAQAAFAGTLLVWVIVTTMVYFLVNYAVMFARLGRHFVKIDLLNSRGLVPFARVATISSLALIGAMALFPLMYLDQSMNMESVLPGIVTMGVPLVGLFAIPVWPVHRRLSAERESALAAVDERIAQAREGASINELDLRQLGALEPLLTFRREILEAPLWPFDAGSVTRMILYIIIVPLTWAGAALLEIIMESYL